MPGRLALKQLDALVRRGEIDTVLTVFPDTFGRLMGKRVVGSYFLDHVADEGAHACIYLFTVDMEMEPLPGFKLTSWERGYGDMKVVPDLGTLRVVPWLAKTALVFCDVYTEEGEPIEEAPRWVLKRQVARAAAQGFVVKTAAELELYCFRESFEEARAKRYHALTPVAGYLEDYHILQTTKEEPLIRAIRNGMEAADVPVETSKGEWGRGQEEINLRFADALEMADRTALYKHGAKEIAHLMGAAVTFMAKYDMGAAGSSFHLHSSLWDKTGRKALFATGAGAGTRGGSPLFGHWLAGHLAMAREPVAEERRAPSRPRTGARGEEGFPTGLVPERRVEVERRARRAHVVLRHEGDRRAHEVGDLLGPVLVEGRAVGHLERVGVAEIDLLLAAPPLALRRLDRHVGPLHPVPDRADQR